jgi:hypothetical protein
MNGSYLCESLTYLTMNQPFGLFLLVIKNGNWYRPTDLSPA